MSAEVLCCCVGACASWMMLVGLVIVPALAVSERQAEFMALLMGVQGSNEADDAD